MAKDGFRWVPGQPPPQIASHSHAKLNLLAHYLDQYFDTVVVNPAMDKVSISFVDGFSGGGKYLRLGEERPGSPFVLLEAVRSATERLNANRQKPLVIDAHFYFIDDSKDALSYLEAELEARGFGKDIRDGRIQLIKGKFESFYRKIVDAIRERHRDLSP